MTWALAQKVCEHGNAHLASVHSLEEYRMIQRLIFDATYQSGLTWIGGSDAQQNGYWFWIDGTHFSYTKWCSGEPNNLWLVEHCTVMNYSGNKCMNDMSCHKHLPSVCVKKIW
ncbi:unnamed protein product [Oreochromis niloticus]|nr:unnamed protein product [Mustela putorius furo]